MLLLSYWITESALSYDDTSSETTFNQLVIIDSTDPNLKHGTLAEEPLSSLGSDDCLLSGFQPLTSQSSETNYQHLKILLAPFLTGVQKILEGKKDITPASHLGGIVSAIRISQHVNKLASNDTKPLEASFFIDVISDLSLLSANIFLYFTQFESEIPYRLYNTLGKTPSTMNYEFKKLFHKNETLEFVRQSSLCSLELANVYYKHHKSIPHLVGIMIYKSANHAYEFVVDLSSKETYELTPRMMRNLFLGSVFLAQARVQHLELPTALGVFLMFEYLLNAALPFHL